MWIRWSGAIALACAAYAQTPAFEVASVKPSEQITPEMVQSGRLHIGVSIDAQNVRAQQYSMFDLIRLSYQVKAHQLAGPDWMVTARYDIQAKLPNGASRGDVPAMLQALLAERFGMKMHRETRDLNVYALVAAKAGPYLKTSEMPEAAPAGGGPIRGGVSVDGSGRQVSSGSSGDSRVTPGAGGNLHVENKKMTMAAFADFITRYCDRPVFDMTELQGAYEMEFDVSGEEVRAAAQSHGVGLGPPKAEVGDASEPAAVSLAASLRRLGLRLEARKAPAEVIVVDEIRKMPTEN
jgi:uncharacterized protein (TIGR03435 family)